MEVPFTQIKKEDNRVIREFSSKTKEEDLKWHYDLEDRTIIPINENDWYFQRDNCLPERIDKKIFIKAKEWHRVIKGKTNLLVEILFN